MGLCGCLSSIMLTFNATVYLIFGVVLIAASVGTLFTPYGQLVNVFYSISTISLGVLIFLIACIGYFAACDSEKRVGLLWLFTLLTLLMAILSGGAAAVMFQYASM